MDRNVATLIIGAEGYSGAISVHLFPAKGKKTVILNNRCRGCKDSESWAGQILVSTMRRL